MALHQDTSRGGQLYDQPSVIQVPEWETPRNHRTRSPLRSGEERLPEKHQKRRIRVAMLENLDRILPPNRRYFGCRRGVVLGVLGVILVLLILVIGLSAGLTSSSGNQDLPLPSNAKTFTGDLTYYSPALGACGITSSDHDDICAVSHIIFDAASTGSNPNANPLCGQKIRATRFDEQANAQRSVDLTVVDRCTGCAPTDIDLSPGAFDKLANPDLGRVGVTWAWLWPKPTSKS